MTDEKIMLGCYGEILGDLWSALCHMRAKIGRRGNCRPTHCTGGRMPDGEFFLSVPWTWCSPSLASIGQMIKDVLEYATDYKVNGLNYKEHLDENVSLCYTLWNRETCSYERNDVNITVRELRCFYEHVMKRPMAKIKKVYGEAAYEKIVGKPVNPIAAMQRDALLKQLVEVKLEIENITDEVSGRKAEAEKEFNKAWQKKLDEAQRPVWERYNMVMTALSAAGIHNVKVEDARKGKVIWS